jgi:SAM-dependent methyltransferase
VTSVSKQYFDEVAGTWDDLRQGFFSDAVRDAVLADANTKPGDRAADLGAGTGFLTQGLLDRGVSVIAVDQSQPMLDVLRAKFSPRGSVDGRLGEAEQLPIEDASVDQAVANMYLHHVDRPAQTIREMARILKPGGRLVITDLDGHEFEFLRTEHHDRWMGFERAHVRGWLREAGLVDVTVECVGADCCASSHTGDAAAISIFIASGTKPAAPAATPDAVGQVTGPMGGRLAARLKAALRGLLESLVPMDGWLIAERAVRTGRGPRGSYAEPQASVSRRQGVTAAPSTEDGSERT